MVKTKNIKEKSSNLLSVIIPAYRQEKTIVKDLSRIAQVLSKLRYKTEIICVVDGMVDNTYFLAKQFARNRVDIKVLGYRTNKGKGHAIRFGMAESIGDIVAFIDAGMDVNPNGISMLLEHFEWYQADIIIGSKRHPVSKVSYPLLRRIMSMGYQFLVWVLFGLKVKDTQVGLKLFNRKVLKKILPRLLVKTYAFDIEMLAVAYSLGFRKIYEAPVEVTLDFGGASVLTSREFMKYCGSMLVDTLAVFYRLKILNYYRNGNKRRWRYDPELNFKVNIG